MVADLEVQQATFSNPGELGKALKDVGSAIAKQKSWSSPQIWSGIHLTVRGRFLQAEATDLELTLMYHEVLKFEGNLDVVVDKDRLLAALTQIADHSGMNSFKVQVDEQTKTLNFKTTEYSRAISIPIIGPGTDFPPTKHLDPIECLFSVPVDQFKQSATNALPSIATDDSRPALNCLSIRSKGEKAVQFAGADGYRLHVYEQAQGSWSARGKDFNVLIQLTTLKRLMRLLPKEGNVVLQSDSAHVYGQIQDLKHSICAVFMLKQSSFPAYEQLIPKQTETQFTLGPSEREQIVKLLALHKKRMADSIVRLQVYDGNLMVSAKDIDNDTAYVLEHQVYDIDQHGPDQKIAFNVNYLIDALKTFECNESTTIGLNTASQPALFTTKGNTGDSITVMPMFVKKW